MASAIAQDAQITPFSQDYNHGAPWNNFNNENTGHHQRIYMMMTLHAGRKSPLLAVFSNTRKFPPCP